MRKGSEGLGKQVLKSSKKHTARPEDSKGKFSYGESVETPCPQAGKTQLLYTIEALVHFLANKRLCTRYQVSN